MDMTQQVLPGRVATTLPIRLEVIPEKAHHMDIGQIYLKGK